MARGIIGILLFDLHMKSHCERGLHEECQSCSGKGRNFICLLWELVLDKLYWLKCAANGRIILFSLPSDSFYNPDSHYFLTTSCSHFLSLKKQKTKPEKTNHSPKTKQKLQPNETLHSLLYAKIVNL